MSHLFRVHSPWRGAELPTSIALLRGKPRKAQDELSRRLWPRSVGNGAVRALPLPLPPAHDYPFLAQHNLLLMHL